MGLQTGVWIGAYKLDPEPVRKTAGGGAGWLGPLEHSILVTLHRLGLKRFFLRDLTSELPAKPPKICEALKRLCARGIVRKVARGYYELADPSALDLTVRRLPSSVSQEEAEDTGGPLRAPASRGGGATSRSRSSSFSSSGVEFGGIYYDNVMWYDLSGGFRRLGRGVLLDSLPGGGLVYAELTALVRGLRVEGAVVLYSSDEDPQPSVRVEWRPPSGFVRENGFVSVRRMFWLQMLVAFRAISAVLSRAPAWVRRSLARSPILWHNAAGSLYY